MIDYKSLVKTCKNLKLDPDKFGDNPFVDGHPLGAYKEPFSFETIKFPQKQLVQVLMIGQIIYNLVSQSNYYHHYNLTTKEGKKELLRDNAIKEIIPILTLSLDFWLNSGLQKCKVQKELISYNGIFFEVDPIQTEKMDEMNKAMAEVHVDYIQKAGASEISASKVILNS